VPAYMALRYRSVVERRRASPRCIVPPCSTGLPRLPALSDSRITSWLCIVYALATLPSTLTDVCVSSILFTAYLAKLSRLYGSSRLSGLMLTLPLFAIVIRRFYIPLCPFYPLLLAPDCISLMAGCVYLLEL
jgi:hypothetical protein